MFTPESLLFDAMNDPRRYRMRLLLGGVCALAFLMLIAYLVFVATRWGHQFDNEAYFGRSVISRNVVQVQSSILDSITTPSLFLLLIVIVVIGWISKGVVRGIVAAVAVGVAVAGAQVFKAVLPWEYLVPSDYQLPKGLLAETFPSGHTTIGTSLALTAVVLVPAVARMWVAVAAGALASSFGTAVLFAGWHRPSDAMGGVLWAGIVFGCAALVLLFIRRRSADFEPDPDRASLVWPALITSAIGALIVFGLASLGALADGVTRPDLDSDFVWAVLLIVTLGFAVTAWFGFALRALGRPRHAAS